MHEMFWLPCWSIWLAPIIRGGVQTKDVEHGAKGQPGLGLTVDGDGGDAIGEDEVGLGLTWARRAPRRGMAPMGLATMAPSPRNASAQATTQ